MIGFDVLNPEIPLGDWVEAFIEWLQDAIPAFFTAVEVVVSGLFDALNLVLSSPPYYVMILIFAVIAWLASGWKMAIFTAVGFYIIRAVDVWSNAMSSIALVVLGVVIALIISVPIGIWAAKSDTVSRIVKPINDLMQTLSPLVYLVPVIVIFGVGVVPGAIATLIFALPPGVRFTELGIRGVDSEVVEAGRAFGATNGRILRSIELPLAMPTIMAGVNQVIMLALSMVVIAGMGGAGGLGGDITSALQNIDLAHGVNAGLAVVIIAVFLDRVSAGFGSRSAVEKAQRASNK